MFLESPTMCLASTNGFWGFYDVFWAPNLDFGLHDRGSRSCMKVEVFSMWQAALP